MGCGTALELAASRRDLPRLCRRCDLCDDRPGSLRLAVRSLLSMQAGRVLARLLLWGDYDRRPWDRATSPRLIAELRRIG